MAGESLKASIRIGVTDGFSAPLRKLAKSLEAVHAEIGKLGAGGDIFKQLSALQRVRVPGRFARIPGNGAASSVGVATGRAAERQAGSAQKLADRTQKEQDRAQQSALRAQQKAELQGQRLAERDARAQQRVKAQFERAQQRETDRWNKMAQASARVRARENDRSNKQVATSFSAMSARVLASMAAVDGKVDVSAQHLKAFEKLAELKRAQDGLRRLASSAGNVSSELGNADRKASHFRDSIRTIADSTIALGGLRTAFQGMTGVMQKPIVAFADFDAAMASVSAKTGELRGTAGFEALKKQAEDVGAATKYSAEQIARIQYELASSGFSTPQIISATPTIASTATAAEIDPSQAAEIIGATIRQYDMQANDAQRVADLLAKADNKSAASIVGLGESLAYAGTNLHGLNISLPETIGFLSVLANAGLKGSSAGTDLGDTFDRLVAPTKHVKEAFKELGFSAEQVEGLQKQLASGNYGATSVLKQIGDAAKDLAPEKQGEIYEHLFGKQGKRAAMLLIRATADTTQTDTDRDSGGSTPPSPFAISPGFKVVDSSAMSPLDAIRAQLEGKVNPVTGAREGGADGAVAKTAAVIEASAKGQMERASGAIDALVTNIGSKFAPEIERVSALLARMAEGLSKVVDEFPEASKWTVGLGSLAAGGAGIWASLKGVAGLGKLVGLGGAAAPVTGEVVGTAAAKVAAATAAATEAVAGVAGAAGATAAATAGSGALGTMLKFAGRALGPLAAIPLLFDLEGRRKEFASELASPAPDVLAGKRATSKGPAPGAAGAKPPTDNPPGAQAVTDAEIIARQQLEELRKQNAMLAQHHRESQDAARRARSGGGGPLGGMLGVR